MTDQIKLLVSSFVRESQQRLRQERAEELDYLVKQLDLLTRDVKDKIKVMVEDVERKVSERN